jgi:hypothetical protein
MLNHILAFFSDLILITAGIVVCLLWLALLGIITIESWDFFTGWNKKNPEANEEEEDYYQ